MQARPYSKQHDTHPRSPLTLILRSRLLYLALLLGVTFFPWGISLAPTTLAAGPQLLQNRDFETGSLSPWLKYPSTAPGTIGVESCCANHTPSGHWDAF